MECSNWVPTPLENTIAVCRCHKNFAKLHAPARSGCTVRNLALIRLCYVLPWLGLACLPKSSSVELQPFFLHFLLSAFRANVDFHDFMLTDSSKGEKRLFLSLLRYNKTTGRKFRTFGRVFSQPGLIKTLHTFKRLKKRVIKNESRNICRSRY